MKTISQNKYNVLKRGGLRIVFAMLGILLVCSADASITAVLQTYNGTGDDFVTTNSASLSTNSLFMVFLSTNSAGVGFNPSDPTHPLYGDLLLGAYPLAEAGYPSDPGQITGYLAVPYTNEAVGSIYLVVYDYAYASYAGNQTIPEGTDYLVTSNAMAVAKDSGSGGQLTDVGGAINAYVDVNGAFVASKLLPAPSSPSIWLSTNRIDIAAVYRGTDPTETYYNVRNTGAGTLNFTNMIAYSVGADWLSVSPVSGQLTVGNEAQVTCFASVGGLDVGVYTATVSVVDAGANNSPQTLNVVMNVAKADQTITFPEVGTQYETNVVTLSATASSGLSVSFAVVDGPGVINGGNRLSFTATGIVAVTASQTGDANWNAANTVTQNVVVTDIPQVGIIRGYINPAKVQSRGAWRIQGTSTWMSNGATVPDLVPGSYIIEFKTIRGHITPDAQTTVVTVGNVSDVTGTYSVRNVPNDFDGDGYSDIGCYHPASGWWYVFKSEEQVLWTTNYAGGVGTLPVTGDFDGDDICDYGTYYAPDGKWQIMRSSAGQWMNNFGYAGTIPVTGDLDGDGILDFGCYYPEQGWWYIYKSTSGFWLTRFGYENTVPVTGDFDGDGIDDFGCYFAPDGWWYFFLSSVQKVRINQFGYAGTLPVTGDFDGDGTDDYGCYEPDGGHWVVNKSSGGYFTTAFGYEGTLPITGDYDGDGVLDFGCYYPPDGFWYVFLSATQELWIKQFGYSGTIPLKRY